MRVLVTGGLGHIGSALIRSWPEAQITVLDDLSTQRYCSLFDLPLSGGEPIRFVELDLGWPSGKRWDTLPDWDTFRELVAGHDVVVHLAALTDAAASYANVVRTREVNLDGTRLVEDACLEHDRPLVFLSTTSVYGPQSHAVDERLPWKDLTPQTPYASTKWLAERDVLRASNDGLCYSILRCGTVYGTSPGMRFHTFVNRACWRAAHGQPIPIYAGAWDSLRPYLALDHCIAAIKEAAASPLNGVQNVVTGNHTPRQVVELIRRELPDMQTVEVEAPVLNQVGYEVTSCERRMVSPEEAHRRLAQGIRETLWLLRPELRRHASYSGSEYFVPSEWKEV